MIPILTPPSTLTELTPLPVMPNLSPIVQESGIGFTFVIGWLIIFGVLLYTLKKMAGAANSILFTKDGDADLLYMASKLRVKFKELNEKFDNKAAKISSELTNPMPKPHYVTMGKDHEDKAVNLLGPKETNKISFVDNMRLLDREKQN